MSRKPDLNGNNLRPPAVDPFFYLHRPKTAQKTVHKPLKISAAFCETHKDVIADSPKTLTDLNKIVYEKHCGRVQNMYLEFCECVPGDRNRVYILRRAVNGRPHNIIVRCCAWCEKEVRLNTRSPNYVTTVHKRTIMRAKVNDLAGSLSKMSTSDNDRTTGDNQMTDDNKRTDDDNMEC